MKLTLPANRLRYLARWRCRVGYFHDDTWGFTVHLLVGIDGPRLMAYCQKMFPKDAFEMDDTDDWGGRHAMIRFEDKTTGYEVHVVALQDFKMTPHWISVLSHELLHCVHEALDCRGMCFTDEAAEAYCYTHDSLLKRCLVMLGGKK